MFIFNFFNNIFTIFKFFKIKLNIFLINFSFEICIIFCIFLSILVFYNRIKKLKNNKFLFFLNLLFFFNLFFILLNYFNYSETFLFNHICINNKIYYMYLMIFFLFFLFLIASFQFLENYMKNSFEYYFIYNSMAIWLVLLFSTNNIFSFIFIFELLSLSTLLILTIFSNININFYYFNSNRVKNNNLNLLVYSFLYLFWISFLSILGFFLLIIYLFKLTYSFDYYIIELIYNYIYYNLSRFNYTLLLITWILFIFSFFLKLGIMPFFLWKPNFFKSLPNIFLLFYVFLFYFFLYVYFLSLLYSFFYFFIGILGTLNFLFFIFILILLILNLYNITNIKVFIAYSSILNSTLIFFLLLFI